jgi:4-amino-4-deoxy-L-arabinose transferase-like glycosyltransferase
LKKQPVKSRWNSLSPELVVLVLVLFGLARRLTGLGDRPFWFDEAISAIYARQDVASLFDLNSGDNHPFGYYLTLKFWIDLFGYSDWVIRLLSAIPGAIAVWLVWLIGRELFPEKPGINLIATAIMALNPFQVYFSQEARNYSFMQLWVLLGIWCALKGFKENRWLYWVGLGLAAALGLIFNFSTAFYMAALFIWPLFRFRENWQNRLIPKMYLAGGGGALLAGLLLLPKLTGRLGVIKNNFWIPAPEPLIVLRTFYTFIFGAVPANIFLAAFAIAFVLLAVTLGQTFPAWWRDRKADSGLARCLWLLFAPLFLFIVVSLLFQPLYLDKALIASSPFYYLLIGWAIWRPDATQRGGAILAGIPLLLALVVGSLLQPALYNGQLQPLYIARYNVPQINQYLSQEKADALVTATDIAWLPLEYYGKDRLPPKYPLADYPYPNIFPLLLKKMNSESVQQGEIGQRFTRFWVLFELNPPDGPVSEPRPAKLGGEILWMHSSEWQTNLLAYFNQNYKRLKAVELDRVLLVLYEK